MIKTLQCYYTDTPISQTIIV